MIIRVFRGTVRPNKEAEYARLLHDVAVPSFLAHPGMIRVDVGLPTMISPREFLVETAWRDLGDLKAFAGDDWGRAVIHSDEEHLLEKTSVHHYEQLTGSTHRELSNGGGVLDVGRLQVDLNRRTATLDGRDIELPPRELNLLRELAINVGHPLSAEDLARRVWPPGSWSTADDVRRAVYQLRRLLGDHEREVPLIRNRRGHGYLLEVSRGTG